MFLREKSKSIWISEEHRLLISQAKNCVKIRRRRLIVDEREEKKRAVYTEKRQLWILFLCCQSMAHIFMLLRKHFFPLAQRTCIFFSCFLRTFVFEFNASIYITATHTSDRIKRISGLYVDTMNKCRPNFDKVVFQRIILGTCEMFEFVFGIVLRLFKFVFWVIFGHDSDSRF